MNYFRPHPSNKNLHHYPTQNNLIQFKSKQNNPPCTTTQVYVSAMNYFRAVTRELKRLDALSRSPIYSHFSETLVRACLSPSPVCVPCLP